MAKSIPKLFMYYPSEERMNQKQLQFYKLAEKELASGSYVEVGDNIGYVFTYLYKVLQRHEKFGAKSVYENLMHISELYGHQPKLKDYCIFWGGECLLAERLYEQFVVENETNPVWKGSYMPQLRLNLRRILKWDHGWELDLVQLFGARTSTFIKTNAGIYRDFLNDEIQAYVNDKGGWSKYFKWLTQGGKPYEHLLFGGAPIDKLPMPDLVYGLTLRAPEVQTPIKEMCRTAENKARAHLGLPAIGEGWVSETQLFKEIQTHFAQTEVLQHGRPHFLGRQHYDIWMPQWGVAVEFHGIQHFEAIEFFGGEEAFQKNVARDQRKIELSKQNGVHLFVVTHGYEIQDLLENIAATRGGRDFGLRDFDAITA